MSERKEQVDQQTEEIADILMERLADMGAAFSIERTEKNQWFIEAFVSDPRIGEEAGGD